MTILTKGTMAVRAMLMVLPALISSSSAQNDSPEYALSLTFYDSSRTYNCGEGSVANNVSNAISFNTNSVPTRFTCVDLYDIFSNPNENYTTGVSDDCTYGHACGLPYTLSGVENFNVSANYSAIFYHNVYDYSKSASSYSSVKVQTYGGKNCFQGMPDNNTEESLYPWTRWTCQSDSECKTLPYSIQSIGILPIDESNKKHHCETGTYEGGAGVYEKYGGAGAVLPPSYSLLTLGTLVAAIAWTGLA